MVHEPPYSCPNLDEAIAEIEKARKIHEDLRTWGNDWKDKYEELQKEHEDKIDEKNKIIQSLEDEIDGLQDEIKGLRNEISAQS